MNNLTLYSILLNTAPNVLGIKKKFDCVPQVALEVGNRTPFRDCCMKECFIEQIARGPDGYCVKGNEIHSLGRVYITPSEYLIRKELISFKGTT
jgi:hypothetical protein